MVRATKPPPKPAVKKAAVTTSAPKKKPKLEVAEAASSSSDQTTKHDVYTVTCDKKKLVKCARTPCHIVYCPKDSCGDHSNKDSGWTCYMCDNWVCEDCLENMKRCEYNDCICCPICTADHDCSTVYCEDCEYSHEKHCRECN